MRRHRFPLLMSCFAATACQLPHGTAPATPQRPTVSVNTSTTARGTLELESGVAVDPGDAFDSPLTLKYGTGEDSELFVGWSPWQQLRQPGTDAEGSSDVVLGTRHRLWRAADGGPSGAVLLSGKLPTATTADGLGSGEVDLRVGAILNQQFGDLNANAFYQYGALGLPGGGTTSEHTATLTAGLPLGARLGGFVELASVFVPRSRTDSVFAIVGATWTSSPSLVFDAGATVGLSDDAPDLQLFAGCTWNLGAPLGRD